MTPVPMPRRVARLPGCSRRYVNAIQIAHELAIYLVNRDQRQEENCHTDPAPL